MKKAQTHNLSQFGAISVLCIVIATSLASLTGVFRALDNHFNDVLQQLQPPSRRPSDVLLVYAPQTFFDEHSCAQLAQLANELLVFDARKIGLLFSPDHEQLNCLNELAFAEKLVTGSAGGAQTKHEQQKSNQLAMTAGSGILDLNLNQSVYREHRIRVASGGQVNDSFELVMAEPFLPTSYRPNQWLGIRFAGGPNSLPHIRAKEVLNHEIVSELVHGKIVLIGPEPGAEIGFETPTTRGAERMSRLELHGNVLNTLLTKSEITKPGFSVEFVLLLLGTFVVCQLFRQASCNQILTVYALSILLVMLLGWLAIHFLAVKLPVTSILVAQCLILLKTIRLRFETLKEVIDGWNLMRITGSHSDWRAEEKDTWTLISDSVYQIFYPNRMVLMELNPGATHLSVTKTIHCTPDDIFERRRDVNREPYREAVELGAAMEIRNRQFFVRRDKSQGLEFIAPLILVSELVGFMVLEMSEQSVRNWDDFENFLTRFTSDMAVLVSKYRILQQQETRQQNFLEQLKHVPEQTRKLSIFQSEVEHRNLEQLLGDAFETIQTAGVIYDVFGRTIKTNAKMVELLQRNGIVIDNTDCISLLEALTGLHKNDCRKLFRQCVVEGSTQHIFLPQESQQVTPRVLYLEPLNKGDDEPEISSRCVCIQIVEGKIFQESQVWQQEFAKNNLQQVNQRLENVQKLTDQLRTRERRKPSGMGERLAIDILDSVAECQSLLDSRFDEDPNNFLLLDSQKIWESCLTKLRPKLEARCIKIVPRFDSDPREVVANPFLLERIFEAAIDCLSSEAAEDVEIVVRSERVDQKVYYHFCDTNGGVPIDDFRKSFEPKKNPIGDAVRGVASSVLTPSQMDRFREIEGWLSTWNGSLSISCNDDYRINVEIELCAELENRQQFDAAIALASVPNGNEG